MTFKKDLIIGLSKKNKRIPSKYHYDLQGSKYFEKITKQKEYYPTRKEKEILKKISKEIPKLFNGKLSYVELGSGAIDKIKLLINKDVKYYVPLDISLDYVRKSVKKLKKQYPKIKIKPKKIDQNTKRLWGMNRSLINNAVLGVTKGHEKNLELSGVGFRANLKGEVLNLQIGFSHDVNFKIPKEIKITVEKQTIIKINGVDKELVTKIAADIKNLKPVEPYKAKGIKERGQFVLRKEGKKK